MKRLVLENIDGIEIYPIISLVIFVALFAGVIIYACKMDKGVAKSLSVMPLDNDNQENSKSYGNPE